MLTKLPFARVVNGRALEITAFITGFSLMVYELVASRILAPTIGSSTYVWTSVIGVIIAALSLGYAFGGWAADKRTKHQDISWLLLACAAAVTSTLVFAPAVLELIGGAGFDARLKGLLAASLLFMPASFLLGAISPYLVRLHTVSLAVAGRSVASLSVLNAIGGIVGTFSAGFIFFGYLGSQETLILVLTLLLAASWLIRPRTQWRARLIFCIIVVVITTTTLLPRASAETVAVLDTPTAHYEIMDVEYRGLPTRVLATGPSGWQSGMYLNRPAELAFAYTNSIANLVHMAPAKQRILVLGGGAYSLPAYLGSQYPQSTVDVVEIDPHLPTIAADYFGYVAPPNVRSIAADGRAFLNTNSQTYDIIIVDVYSDTSIPFAVSTTEYVHQLKRSLSKDGIVMANIIGADSPQCRPLLGALHSTYRRDFTYYQAIPTRSSDMQDAQNIITVYSRTKPAWSRPFDTGITLPSGMILTDNFAPVERLRQQCS